MSKLYLIVWSVLTSALDGCEWSASRAGSFNSGSHWIGSWLDPMADLEAMKKRKFSYPCWESNPGRAVRSPSLYRLSYPGLQTETGLLLFSTHPSAPLSCGIALGRQHSITSAGSMMGATTRGPVLGWLRNEGVKF
jgi:hypothetical protein